MNKEQIIESLESINRTLAIHNRILEKLVDSASQSNDKYAKYDMQLLDMILSLQLEINKINESRKTILNVHEN